jgi:anthranilate phosphoribosyltransferase
VENAALLDRIFSGEPGPKRNIVLLNAAAALVAAGIASDLGEGVARGAEAIDSRAVENVVAKLREFARSVDAPVR